jgi:HAD superfamily hydrolase (TIGR01509 family)
LGIIIIIRWTSTIIQFGKTLRSRGLYLIAMAPWQTPCRFTGSPGRLSHKNINSPLLFYSLGGVPPDEILALISGEQSVDLDADAVAVEKEDLYLTYLHHVKPVNEVVAVAHARHGEIPMGVASGTPRPVLETVLTHLNLLQLFHAWVGGNEVTRSKPAPDIFIEAARRIGVAPEKCLAYEDTDLGMRSARDAGMRVVDVRVLRSRS